MQNEHSPKNWWKTIKLNLGLTSFSSIPILYNNGVLCTTDAEKCETMNAYFASQCNANYDHITNSDGNEDSPGLLNDIVLTDSSILKILKSLNMYKASGPDGINNIVLKKCAESLTYPLKLIFRKSLDDGKFPASWKIANICPIYKKGDKQMAENYRPIALLSTLSKVLERVVYNQLYEFCRLNNILTERNSGFKKTDSAINQLIYLNHLIYQGLDDGDKIAILFLDISRAFDTVWHDGLILKLKRIGIGGKLLKWLRSYLTDRKQKVVLNGFCSSLLEILAGVPQGSILGPLLFLIFSNDMCSGLSTVPFLFADDTSLVAFAKNWKDVENSLNADLNKLDAWSKQWKLKFNLNKCEYIMFGLKNNSTLNVVLQNKTLPCLNSHKHLGIVYNYKFDWSDHVDYIRRKVSKKLGLLFLARYKLNRSALARVYTSMILPVLEYGNIIYDNSSSSDLMILDRLHRRAAVICTGAISRTETAKLYSELGWVTLESRRSIAKLIFMYKLVSKLAPNYLVNLLQNLRRPETNNYSLRKKTEYAIFCGTRKFYKSFLPSTLRSWETLPADVRSIDSLSGFKKVLKTRYNTNTLGLHVLYNQLHGPYTKILTQIRLGLSNLNEHLFTYNLADNPFCAVCLDAVESTSHFLIDCPKYTVIRVNLILSLQRLLGERFSFSRKFLTQICFNGSADFNMDLNKNILMSVKTYIYESNRFV